MYVDDNAISEDGTFIISSNNREIRELPEQGHSNLQKEECEEKQCGENKSGEDSVDKVNIIIMVYSYY